MGDPKVSSNSQIIYTKNGAVSTNPEGATFNSLTLPLVSEEALKADAEYYSVTTITPKTSEEVKRNRIYDLIAVFLDKNGITMEEAKNANFLERIAGCTKEELVNMSQEDLDKVIEAATSGFRLWNMVTDASIDDMVNKGHKKYIRMISGRGWLGELFRKHRGVVDYLRKEGYITAEKPTEQDIERALDLLFTDITNEAIASGNTEKIKKAYDKALELFKSLNIDTQGEERGHLAHIIAKLEAGSRYYAEQLAIKGSSSAEERAIVAESVVENFEEIVTSEDALGEVPDKEVSAQIADIAYTHLTKEALEKALSELYTNAEEFFKNHAQEIEALKAKRDRGETLTEEEQKLLTEAENVYYAQYAGSMTGTSKNSNLTEQEKTSTYQRIFEDTESIGIKEEVVETVSDFIEEHPEVLLSQSKEKFIKMIDDATNNAYTETLKQIQTQNNNENVQIKPQTETKNNQNSNTVEQNAENTSASNTDAVENTQEETPYFSASLGFEVKASVDTTRLETLTNQIKETTSGEEDAILEKKSSEDIVAASRKGIEGFKRFIENNGTTEAVIAVFKNFKDIRNQGVIAHALNLYKTLAPSLQADTLRKVSNAGLALLLKETPAATLKECGDKVFSNYYATELVREKVEEAEEKRV